MAELIFFAASIGAIGGAVGVVWLRNPFYSVLALVFHLLSLAALFLLLRAEFLAAAQVVVYAGAVMVLYVFVVAYVGGDRMDELAGIATRSSLIAPLICAALFVELVIAILGSGLAALGEEGAGYEPGFGSPAEIGELLLTDFLLVFELASFLLLIAAVGAVVLARRRRGIDEQYHPRQEVPQLRPAGTGTMAEGVEGRLPAPPESPAEAR